MKETTTISSELQRFIELHKIPSLISLLQIEDEILISTHICHPSLCNDNLSGIVITTFLAKELIKNKNKRYSFRFIFIPATIGAITWLSVNEHKTINIKGGFVFTLLGDNSNFTFKKTREGDSWIDKASINALKSFGSDSGNPCPPDEDCSVFATP